VSDVSALLPYGVIIAVIGVLFSQRSPMPTRIKLTGIDGGAPVAD